MEQTNTQTNTQKSTQKLKTNLCAAAKRFQTKGEAFQHLKANNENNILYIIEEVTNGQLKKSCYGRCCNSVHEGELCHIHRNQQKREKSIFLNYEKDIKNKCDDNKIKIAKSTSSYFEKVSERGNKKNKNKKTMLDYFDNNKDDPIYVILTLNTEHLNYLRLHATKLLQSSTDSKKEKSEVDFIENNQRSSNSKLIDSINKFSKDYEESNHLKKNPNNLKNMIENDEIDDILDDILDDINENDNKVSVKSSIELNKLIYSNELDDFSDNESMSTQEILDFEVNELQQNEESKSIFIEDEVIEDEVIEDKVIDDEFIEDEVIDDEDDSYDVDTIYTNKGKLLYLEPSSMNVIEPEGENDGTSIGILHKINKKYSTIERDNEYYTVLSQNKLIHESKEYYRDVLNDRIFEIINKELIFKGRVTKKNNLFKFHLD